MAEAAVRGQNVTVVEASVAHVSKMRHKATVSNVKFLEHALQTRPEAPLVDGLDGATARLQKREFIFYSDEPEYLGGDDAYPVPLEYFGAAIGMCLTTQLVRFAKLLHLNISGLRVGVRIDWEREGSVLAGTLVVRCTGATSRIELDSTDDRAKIDHLIQVAKAGCFAEAALVQPVDVRTELILNGTHTSPASGDPRNSA